MQFNYKIENYYPYENRVFVNAVSHTAFVVLALFVAGAAL
jgi:hypothetical protein